MLDPVHNAIKNFPRGRTMNVKEFLTGANSILHSFGECTVFEPPKYGTTLDGTIGFTCVRLTSFK